VFSPGRPSRLAVKIYFVPSFRNPFKTFRNMCTWHSLFSTHININISNITVGFLMLT
jgi:hypothetical protein